MESMHSAPVLCVCPPNDPGLLSGACTPLIGPIADRGISRCCCWRLLTSEAAPSPTLHRDGPRSLGPNLRGAENWGWGVWLPQGAGQEGRGCRGRPAEVRVGGGRHPCCSPGSPVQWGKGGPPTPLPGPGPLDLRVCSLRLAQDVLLLCGPRPPQDPIHLSSWGCRGIRWGGVCEQPLRPAERQGIQDSQR